MSLFDSRLTDFFNDEIAFTEILREAEAGADGDWQENFIANIELQYDKWGFEKMFFTEAQYRKLIEIGS